VLSGTYLEGKCPSYFSFPYLEISGDLWKYLFRKNQLEKKGLLVIESLRMLKSKLVCENMVLVDMCISNVCLIFYLSQRRYVAFVSFFFLQFI
jgi:hypothetical protein